MNTPKGDTPPLREQFRARLIDLRLPAKTHPYLETWAESFMKAKGYRAAENTHAYFAALSRSARIADWQFEQAIQSARILACDLLNLPWADSFDWETLSLEAKDPPKTHRAFLRESIPVDPESPPPSESGPASIKGDVLNRSRRTLRLTGKAVATEKTYCQWISDIPMPPASSRGAFSSRPPSSVLIPASGNSPGIISSKTPCPNQNNDRKRNQSTRPTPPDEESE